MGIQETDIHFPAKLHAGLTAMNNYGPSNYGFWA